MVISDLREITTPQNPDYNESIQCLTRRFVLLTFCPLGGEEDLGAQSLFDLVADTLSTFNRPWDLFSS
ncbi:hypothetical protein Pcac1_g25745 [Phytophthora cactorum]|uniref:Uncharacterized protein n=1 Tax=Phytophthora cactorum TaxID=29920 RepID=A0A329RH03_9STRA|nr:hypothetical protein Pcac1_g25745 [Phytophthora cactorum]KAG2800786.1 hypothetical protein PC111_g19826 [Phytophthora cactorum]KAG2803454.1 hypothetical protein PC112_g19161 [Phytophthora cactorum]KAG2841300.1 hypothetical protein PC113_g19063 [Phytophthora cactorum]KAG2964614.1 hypothetical protein PC118_g20217 [Phytophthora cactorum]